MEALPLRAGGEMDSIIDRYQTMVYGLALDRTATGPTPTTCFRRYFLAYCQCGKTFRDEEHRKAWLLRTTINQSRRVTSSSWRQKTVPLSEREDVPIQFQEPEENEVWTALTISGRGLPPAHLPVLLPGAVHPGDRQNSGDTPRSRPDAADKGPGAAPGEAERSVF